MNVLSLFDGMSCGQLALKKAGIAVGYYLASEIDKHAIKVTQSEFPATKQIGDVCAINSNNLPEIGLIIGGSPCQGFSFAGKGLNFSDPRSLLFFQYVRLLEDVQPKYFLLENVRMSKRNEDIITKTLGVEPLFINSSLVSAQDRKRLYWTNIPNVSIPIDKNISISDIVGRKVIGCASRARYIHGGFGKTHQKIEFRKDNKANAMTTVKKNSLIFENGTHRNLTRNEAEALQTVPSGYTAAASDNQAFRMLGSGWTVDVIAHILSFINK